MLVYVITDKEDGEVIIVASSQKNAQQQLFDYMGYDPNKPNDYVIYLGYEEYVYSEHEDDFKGVYSFRGKYGEEWVDDKFNLFCKFLDQNQKL